MTEIHLRAYGADLEAMQAEVAALGQALGFDLRLVRRRGLTIIETDATTLESAGRVINALLEPFPMERSRVRIRGVEDILHAIRVSEETLDLVLAAAKGVGDFESIELPDAEARLWFDVRPHPEWREGNLPRVDPEVGSWVQCLRCGERLRGSRAVLWLIPSGHLAGMWSTVGLHLPDCR